MPLVPPRIQKVSVRDLCEWFVAHDAVMCIVVVFYEYCYGLLDVLFKMLIAKYMPPKI